MRTTSRRLGGFTLLAASAMLITGCTAPGETASDQDQIEGNRVSGDLNTVNTADVTGEGEITMAIEKTINNWNTLSAAGDISETVWVTSALYPSAFVIQPDGSTIEMNEDLLDSAEVVQDSPTVVEYKINPDAVWSDGVPITADDFVYQWQVLNRVDCAECQTHDSDGLDKVVSVVGSDAGKTVTVTYDGPFAEWQRPFGRLLPAHLGQAAGDLFTSFNTFFTVNAPTFSGGPFIITDFKKDVSVTLEPNPEWYGEAPGLQKITFVMITDTQQTPIALRNGEIQAMYPQPQVDLLTDVESMGELGVNYQLNQSLVMEAIQFNLSNSFLADKVVRQAVFTALDQQEIIDKTVGQFDDSVKPLGSVMIMQQQQGYENKTDDLGYGKGDTDAAIAMLEEAGYSIVDGKLTLPDGTEAPALRTVYSVGNKVREASLDVLSAAVKPLGITLNLETTDALGDSTGEKSPYGYDIIIVGYTGSPFLGSNAFKRFTSDTGYNKHYSSPEVDALVDQALAATDPDAVIDLINQADQIVVEDVFMMPIYQKPSMFAYDKTFGNLRDNPTMSGPTYNIVDWGVVAQ